MRVLIAEDDVTCRRFLEKTLQCAGHQVVSVANGREALDVLRESDFDALLTDWMMPNVDGLEFVRRVRAAHETPPVILIITSVDHRGAADEAIEAGADDYLAKPLRADELIPRIEACLGRRTG